MLLVEGLSGTGKSRLLVEAVEAAAGRGFMLARGAADESGRLAPLAPLMAAFGVSPQTLLAAGGLGRSDAVDLRLWLVGRLQARLEERVAHGPLLVTLDDLQWADPTTLLALRSLIPELASYPLVWMLSHTAGGGSGVDRLFEVLERDGATRIVLEALGEQVVAEIITDVLGAVPAPELLALASGAGGNPFLLVELVEGLRDEGAVKVADGHACLVSRRLPQRVQEIARSRLGRLSADTRYLLRVAAVLGRSFRVDDLADMLGELTSRLLPELEEAEASGVLVPAGDTLMFRHDLLWQAVSETLTVPVRLALHRQAAEMLLNRGGSAVPAAAHLMCYARPGDTHALAGLDRAAREVLPSSPQTAAELAVRALDLTDLFDPGRFDRTVTAVNALTTAGRLPEAAKLARAGLSQAELPRQGAHLRIELANTLLMAGRAADAVAEAETALGQQDLSDELRGRAEQVLFRGLLGDQYRRGQERAERIVAAPAQHSTAAVVGAHALLAHIALAEGQAADVIGHSREAARIAVCDPIRARHVQPRLHLAIVLTVMRQLEEAESVLQAATEETTALGETAYAASPALVRARLRFVEGRLDDAAAEAQAGLAMADQTGMHVLDLLGITVLAIVAVHRGDIDAAAAYAARYEAQRQTGQGPVFASYWGDWVMAQVAEARDGPDKAIGLLHASYTDPSQRRWLLTAEPDAAAWLTRTALAAADRSSAETIATTAEHLARDNPDFPSLTASAAHANGILNHDPAALSHAAATHPDPWSRASAAEDLGVLLTHTATDRGHDAAIHSLDQALHGYQQAGALRDAARVRARLRKLGVRRRHGTRSERPTSGWASLTDTEHNVATLVTQGLTNPQIATQMFISPNTVKFHLSQIFRKLDIGSRAELARLVATHTP